MKKKKIYLQGFFLDLIKMSLLPFPIPTPYPHQQLPFNW